MNDEFSGATPSERAYWRELVDRYETWRQRWLSTVGTTRGDAAEWSDSRLWFRDGYPYPDWRGLALERSGNGYLVLTVWTERRTSPGIAIKSMYSRLEDAGKYVIADIGDSLRKECGLEPLFQQWQRAGVRDGIAKSSDVDENIVRFIADRNGVSHDVIRRFTHKYSVKSEPSVYAYSATSSEPMVNVMLLSYDELDTLLCEGLPCIVD
ncbi:MAG TPA: hypothetical protein VFA16_14255 [Mycobacterium sp.]|uniref:hypothetical protein n=1 Tax=Mycobacterium sp. TaxID=1785 RepID=UPI002D65EAC7|nr:hypothetical protein [Mycobacterium sp.]HZU48392.1 hypothetical protein [Mycobacterium sp.]